VSRVGNAPITFDPGKVSVAITGDTVTVKGPKGELTCRVHGEMKVEVADGVVRVQRPSDGRRHRSLHGLTRSLLANMVHGVTEGYSKTLELVGTGYRASKSGSRLVISLGFSHPVEMDPPEGIEVEVPNNTTIIVKGSDKQLVGEFAAKVRAKRPPEPYRGKGIRYAGEHVRRKVGKTG